MHWQRFYQNKAWYMVRQSYSTCTMHHAPSFILLLLVSVWLFSRPQLIFAHNELRTSIPTPGDILSESPPEIRLTFSEPPANTFIRLFDDQFHEIPGLNVLPSGLNSNEVVATVPQLENGNYTVQWLTLSADNHSVTGAFQFQVQGQKTASSNSIFSSNIIGGILAAAILAGIILFIQQNHSS